MTRYRRSRGFSLGPIGFLIIVNLIMFVVVLVRPELRYELGLTPELFLERPWTLLTSMFIHAGFWHIFANMFTLYFFGNYVHALIGEGKFLVVYFLGGFVGGIFYLLLEPYGITAVGASGAIFAVAGVLVVMRPNLRVIVFPIPIPIPLWVAVLGGFAIMSFASFVAWQAHLGGLAMGLIAGVIFRRGIRLFRS